MAHIKLVMKKGNLVCEKMAAGITMCLMPAKDYRRMPIESKGWPDPNMPIALCDQHAGKRIPLDQPYRFKRLDAA